MYSNCLFEALKAKIKDPKNVKVLFIPPSINKNRIHFCWSDENKIYSYVDPKAKPTTKISLGFNGELKIYDKKYFEGLIIMRMYNAKYSIKKAVKTAKKLGLKTCTPADMREAFDAEEALS